MQRAAGFTLVELLITMTIIGILAAVAFPSYQSYTTRTHRAAAKACLSEHAQFMERYYTTNLTYVDADENLPLSCQTESNLDERYTITTSDLAQGTYTVTATPIGIQATRDTHCRALGLDQSGHRTASASDCW